MHYYNLHIISYYVLENRKKVVNYIIIKWKYVYHISHGGDDQVHNLPI